MKKPNENPTDFESCKNMIYKLAKNKYLQMKNKRPDVQFEDLYSEGQLIYCVCLKSYTGSKGTKFTTYLYQNLKGRLADFYKCTFKEIHHYEDAVSDKSKFSKKFDEITSYEDRIISKDYEIDNNNLFITAKEELSYEGFQVFKYIISRDWENSHAKLKPSVKSICQKFGYTPEIVDSIMGEIRDFWNKTGYAVA